MKHIAKPELSKKQLAAIILSAVFVVMLAVSITLALVLKNKEKAEEPKEPPEILEGEARQNGLTLAYPTVNEKSQIQNIAVKNENGAEGGFKEFYLNGVKLDQPYVAECDMKDENEVVVIM